MRGALLLAALAGLGGIGSEVVWLHVVDHAAGHMPLGAAITVACFVLLGGLGARWAGALGRPALLAATAALVDGALALHLDAVMAATGAWIAATAPTLGLALASGLAGAGLTALPATLAGATLPVLMQVAGAGERAYAAHAAGAVVGVVALEAAVYPALGLSGALAALVVVHAAVALGVARARPPRPAPGRAAWAPRLAVIGAGTGAVQGGWLAVAPLLERPYAFVGPAVVAAMLAGLSLGALAWSRARPSLRRTATLAVAGGAVSLAAAAVRARAPIPEGAWAGALELWLIVLPSAVPIGALVPAYLGDAAGDRRAAGAALASIAVGNAVGLTAVTAGVGVLAPAPWGVVAGLALVMLARGARGAGWAAAALATAALSAAATGDRVLIARAGDTRADHLEIEHLFRGVGSVSAIVRADGLRRLYQTGYQPIDLGARSESLIGAVAGAYTPRHGRALVIGAGSGRTAGTVALSFREVDVVDLDPHTEALCRALSVENHGLVDRPNVRLHRFDGLLAPFVLAPGYDLIVQTVDPGYHALAAKLYTVEHLTRLRGLLAAGGVLVFWSDATSSARANQVLVNTGRAVFREQKLFSAFGGLGRGLGVSYYFLVHSDAPLAYRPGTLRFLFADDAQVRALPLFGGFPPGETAGVPPISLDLEPPPDRPDAPDARRLVVGRFDATTAVHRASRPEPSVLFGGAGPGELRVSAP